MDGTKPQLDTNVLYSPPAPEALEAFARKVCQGLGSSYTSTEIVDGFSTFIKVVADINVKKENKENQRGRVDNAR